MNDICMVVEGGYNTSYIDALIVALFYKPSNNDILLNMRVTKDEFYHLQDLITHNFLDKVKKHYSVSSDVLNEIRNYCISCDWKNNENIVELFKVTDFYQYLIDSFGYKYITFNVPNHTNIELPYIKLNMPHNDYENASIDELLDTWSMEHLSDGWRFSYIPTLLPLHIDRTNGNTRGVDIMKKIKFNVNVIEEQKNNTWNIHSVICYSEIKSHYYVLTLSSSNEWILYNSTLKPSMYKITNMTNEQISNRIKQECVFIFYVK